VKPDSLLKRFRTAHNRVVVDGEGIVPDSTVPDDPSSKLLDELNRKAMLFKYANHLATQKKTISEDFDVTNDLMRDFEGFLKEKEFRYEEEPEVKLKELRESAAKARYAKPFYEALDQMTKMIDVEKARSFERYGIEIRKALRLEIIERLRGEKAAIQASFKDDVQLQVAASLLKNKKVYAGLLSSGGK
jgi:hypothetical protein